MSDDDQQEDEPMSDDASSSSSSSAGPPVPAAVLSRSRRSTAGTRMTSLVGKAAEADETFWSHKTWAEEGGYGSAVSGSGSDGVDSDELSSGASSFRESDEDEEDRVDAFDSDFDDSEDEENEEEAQRLAAEREEEMKREERRAKSARGQRAGAYADIAASAGRELLKKKVGSKRGKKGQRAGMGDGMNAGLVLNFPGAALQPRPGAASAIIPAGGVAAAAGGAAKAAAGAAAAVAGPASNVPKPAAPGAASPTAKSKRPARRHSARPTHNVDGTTKRSLRAVTVAKSIETNEAVQIANRETAKRQAQIAARERTNPTKRRFTQEELLIEAANVTEPENERWILSRKRFMDQADALQTNLHGKHHHKKDGGSGGGGRVISKFHSRRGCYNTITFLEMDAVPEILSRRNKPTRVGVGQGEGHAAAANVEEGEMNDGKKGSAAAASERLCIITGKKARYRDPKTMLGYHDIAAFKELRRRWEAGELVDPRKGAHKSQKKKRKAAEALEKKGGENVPVEGGTTDGGQADVVMASPSSSSTSSSSVSLHVQVSVENLPGGGIAATAVRRPKKGKAAPVPTSVSVGGEEAVVAKAASASAFVPSAASPANAKPAPDVGKGWMVSEVKRKGGKTAGQMDRYWHSPCGQTFRSKAEIRRFKDALAAKEPTSAPTGKASTVGVSSVAVNTNISIPSSPPSATAVPSVVAVETSSSSKVPVPTPAPAQVPSQAMDEARHPPPPKQDLSPEKEEQDLMAQRDVAPSPGTLVANALKTYRKMSEEQCEEE